MEVSADQVGLYGNDRCSYENIEYRELRLHDPISNLGFSFGLNGDRDSIIDIGNYTYANLFTDNMGKFMCRAAANGNFGAVSCLDSVLISGRYRYNVIQHIGVASNDTLYFDTEFGILKVCKQGGDRLERLW